MRRTVDKLGMTAREAVSVLRALQPDELFAFGPALTRSVTWLTIAGVHTTHPKVGDQFSIRTPAPSRAADYHPE